MVLEKVTNTSSALDVQYANFSFIDLNAIGEGICFVQEVQNKITKYGKPFIVLYLQDINDIVMPGYIWDVSDYVKAGLDMARVKRQVIKIKFRENYIPKFGMSITVDDVKLVEKPTKEMLERFLGGVPNAYDKLKELASMLTEELKINITLPNNICSISHVDYEQGKIGGLIIHYLNMYRHIKVYSDSLPVQERMHLWGVFLIFIYVHSNYTLASSNDEVDVNLINELTNAVAAYVKKLGVNNGIYEVVQMHFGYKPKDMFVRLVQDINESISKFNKEYYTYRTLPITREGDAGYGTIKKYQFGKDI